MRACRIHIDGNLTDMAVRHMSYEDAKVDATENSLDNAWNVNGNNGNVNNNNRNNENHSLAVAACVESGMLKEFIEAFHDCARRKKTTVGYLEYLSQMHKDLPILAKEVEEQTWQPSDSHCFMVEYPKLRECFAASFRDRIVHHWLILRLLPLFEKRCEELHNVSHACRKGFGCKTAVEQVRMNMERISENYRSQAWVYKGDIISFFMNINQRKLWLMLKRLIEEQYDGADKDTVLYVCEKCVMERPEEHCTLVGSASRWDELPTTKSLFNSNKECGEAIGNLTTQHFAGYYMSFFDEYVLRLFKGKNFGYTRSVDDFVVVCNDKKFLKESVKKMNEYLATELGLRTHEDEAYLQPVGRGVKFLGRWIKPHREYVIRRNINSLYNAFMRLCEICRNKPTISQLAVYESKINSRLGIMKGLRTYGYRKRLLSMATETFFKYYYIVGLKKIRLKQQYRLIA